MSVYVRSKCADREILCVRAARDNMYLTNGRSVTRISEKKVKIVGSWAFQSKTVREISPYFE